MHAFALADNFPQKLMREVRTRASHLHDQWRELQKAHKELIHVTADDEQRDHHRDLFTEAEERFLTADAILQERIEQMHQMCDAAPSENGDDHEDSDQNSEGSGVHDNVRPVQQPPQQDASLIGASAIIGQLPWQLRVQNIWGEFDGDRKKWASFHDAFKKSIYENPSIPAVEKFQILRAALKGKAAKALGEWPIRECFFEPAWERLQELYDDSYVLSKELFQKIFTLKKLDSPNGDRLQIMSNVTLETSRQLKALGYPSEHYDLMFIHSVQSKLDEKTSLAWNLHRKSDTPTLTEFITFLDRQAKALNSAYTIERASQFQSDNDRRPSSFGHGQTTRKRHHNGKSYHGNEKRSKSNNSQSNQVAVKTEKAACACCSEDHLTRKRPKFLQMSLTKRKDQARAANICFNCLLPNHTVKECKSGKCNRCEKKHNSLLCTENSNNRHLSVGQVATKKSKQKKSNKKNQSNQQ